MLAHTRLLCFAHLRWHFVFQRPQHVLSRLASRFYVYYFEEPQFEECPPTLRLQPVAPGVTVITPVLPVGTSSEDAVGWQRRLLHNFAAERAIEDPVLWYYTPMALEFSRELPASAIVYDCMDELSLFADAPPKLRQNEADLLARADAVFTGGRSLFHAKRKNHHNVHCFPSAVDEVHFAPASRPEPADMRTIPHPRLGFYGVIDERFDTALVADVARRMPAAHIVLLGPVAKIDPQKLPRASNIHYLGMKSYQELPAYLEHWDIAFLPFALNAATRFISPTKTLEYLAARKPVISTPISDVVDPYGTSGLVAIASNADEFSDVAARMLREPLSPQWEGRVAETVSAASWDATVNNMDALLQPLVNRGGELAV